MNVEFEGVLLLPLDQQRDPAPHIDPAGVGFRTEPYPITRDFTHDPRHILGSGIVSRREDGALVVRGTLNEPLVEDLRLAIGISTATPADESIIRDSVLWEVSMTQRHADPGQPPIAIIRR